MKNPNAWPSACLNGSRAVSIAGPSSPPLNTHPPLAAHFNLVEGVIKQEAVLTQRRPFGPGGPTGVISWASRGWPVLYGLVYSVGPPRELRRL